MSPSASKQVSVSQISYRSKNKQEKQRCAGVRHKAHLTNLSEERNELVRTPPRILVYRLPVIIVRGARAGVHHVCSIRNGQGVFAHPSLGVSLFSSLSRSEKNGARMRGRREDVESNVQFTLPPPP